MLKGQGYVIMNISTSENDKGSNTVSVSANDVLGGSRSVRETWASDQNVEIAHVEKQQYELVSNIYLHNQISTNSKAD